MADHISGLVLEEYSLDKLAESGLAAVEEHLLVCEHCRAWLDAIGPANFVHFTEDGPAYSRATLFATGQVMARHWGKSLDRGSVSESFCRSDIPE
jgi:predicted anti-sigma-YlaC factor YlaD